MNRIRLFWVILICFHLSAFSVLYAQTILSPGDLAILGVNANLNGCDGDSGEDEVSFVCFKDLDTNTEIQITDNGWQRRFAGQWGNAEGFINARRTGAPIPAGTVVTFRLRSIAGANDSGYRAVAPDDGWEFTNEAFNTLNFNSGGDQIFFMQGGIWDNGAVNSGFDFQHDAVYTGGTILFAFNSTTTWEDFADDSKDSGLPQDVTPCYFMAPTGGTTNFISYTGSIAPATQLEWIARIANPNNWSPYSECSAYQSPPASIEILPSGMKIECSTCKGCTQLDDTLTFTLPFGGPFNITYTDGQEVYSLNSIDDGFTQNVAISQTTQFDLVSVEDVDGCPIYSSFEEGALLEILEPIDASLDTTLCAGESLSINGNTYDEINPSGMEVLQTADGCDSVLTINLTFESALSGRILGDTSICSGASATLTFELSGADQFDVTYTDDVTTPVQLKDVRSGYSIEVFPSQNMTYHILAIEAPGIKCGVSNQSGAEVKVIEPSLELTPSNYNFYNISCSDSSDGAISAAVANGEAPYSFSWSTGDTEPQISDLAAGLYRLTVSDALGCQAEASLELIPPPPLSLLATAISEGCSGENAGLIRINAIQGGTPDYEYSTDGQFFQSAPPAPFNISNLSPGAYTLQVQDINDCQTELSLNLEAPPALFLDLGTDRKIKLGDSLLLEPVLNFKPENIEWSPQEYLEEPENLNTVAKPPFSTAYRLSAQDAFGCLVSDEIFIEVDDSRSAFAPNVFNPGDDSENNRFTFYGGTDLQSIKQLRIFDRWGDLVFERENLAPNDLEAGWDGDYQGQKLGSGVFVYSAVLLFADGTEKAVQGDVLLIRE